MNSYPVKFISNTKCVFYFVENLFCKVWGLSHGNYLFYLKKDWEKHGNTQTEVDGVSVVGCMNNGDLKKK